MVVYVFKSIESTVSSLNIQESCGFAVFPKA